MSSLRVGDRIDFRPPSLSAGAAAAASPQALPSYDWVEAVIKKFDESSGQVQVQYRDQFTRKTRLYWAHLDDVEECALYGHAAPIGANAPLFPRKRRPTLEEEEKAEFVDDDDEAGAQPARRRGAPGTGARGSVEGSPYRVDRMDAVGEEGALQVDASPLDDFRPLPLPARTHPALLSTQDAQSYSVDALERYKFANSRGVHIGRGFQSHDREVGAAAGAASGARKTRQSYSAGDRHRGKHNEGVLKTRFLQHGAPLDDRRGMPTANASGPISGSYRAVATAPRSGSGNVASSRRDRARGRAYVPQRRRGIGNGVTGVHQSGTRTVPATPIDVRAGAKPKPAPENRPFLASSGPRRGARGRQALHNTPVAPIENFASERSIDTGGTGTASSGSSHVYLDLKKRQSLSSRMKSEIL